MTPPALAQAGVPGPSVFAIRGRQRHESGAFHIQRALVGCAGPWAGSALTEPGLPGLSGQGTRGQEKAHTIAEASSLRPPRVIKASGPGASSFLRVSSLS